MKFGDNLHNLRKSKKLSQEKLAEKVGVSRQSVSKWECGEAYPEMNNIVILCSIFHCKLNDLILEDLTDIDSLDEEVKMNIVKFKKEKQNKMKGLSRAIYIIARIGKIASVIGAVCIIITMLVVPFIINNIKIKDNNTIEIFGEDVEYQNIDNTLEIRYGNGKYITHNSNEKITINTIIDISEKNSDLILIGYIETTLAFLFTTIILTYQILLHLEKLFNNIYNGETPFTMENANHIKKMAIFMIAIIILPKIGTAILETLVKQGLGIGFDLFEIIQILFLFSMVYIFEYGYEIQLDSKGKMYGEDNE